MKSEQFDCPKTCQCKSTNKFKKSLVLLFMCPGTCRKVESSWKLKSVRGNIYLHLAMKFDCQVSLPSAYVYFLIHFLISPSFQPFKLEITSINLNYVNKQCT